MERLAEEVEWEWKRLASSKLDESKDKYLDGFSVEKVGKEVRVRLDGFLASALERGASSYDLKPGFLKGRIWRNIPMGHPTVNRFRRVSWNSSGWKHPGFKPMGIADEVQEAVSNRIVPEIFDELIGQIKI